MPNINFHPEPRPIFGIFGNIPSFKTIEKFLGNIQKSRLLDTNFPTEGLRSNVEVLLIFLGRSLSIRSCIFATNHWHRPFETQPFKGSLQVPSIFLLIAFLLLPFWGYPNKGLHISAAICPKLTICLIALDQGFYHVKNLVKQFLFFPPPPPPPPLEIIEYSVIRPIETYNDNPEDLLCAWDVK